MCKYKSAIVVLKTGGFDLLHSPNVDSHEDLISLFGLVDTEINGAPRFARVEFYPADRADLPNIDKYVLRVDEVRTPDWFPEIEEQVARKLRHICAACILRENKDVLTGGPWIIPEGIEVGRVLEFAVVSYNRGTVSSNRGTVSSNRGTVSDNRGTVS